MPKKVAQPAKNTTKIRNTILSACLDVASVRPWEFVSYLEIAAASELSVAEINKCFPNKSDIVAAIINDLDSEVEEVFFHVDENIPLRDRLFDVLMERIELANQNRAAHISFFKSLGWTKDATCADIALLKSSMTRMARCAGLNTEGMMGGFYLAGLSLAYLWILLTWVNDTSPDLGKTMAELDKTLGRLGMIANYLQKN